jgi:hypothetical protein
MCEESISKLATNPGEWKSVVTSAITKMEGRDVAAAPARPLNPILGFTDSSGRAKLSWGEKKQRCRECVIYNTHQEQKYKALTACVFLALAAVLFFYNGILIDILSFGFGKINYALGQMSLTNNGGNPVFGNNASVPVCWFILIVLTILLLSKLLQVVEYCCFTIKI